MQLVADNQKIDLEDLKKMAKNRFGQAVKAVVDIDKEIMLVDAELHADQEQALLKKGSKQQNLWGINLHPHDPKEEWVEFNSMINLRPHDENMSRGVEDVNIRNKIVQIVNRLIKA